MKRTFIEPKTPKICEDCEKVGGSTKWRINPYVHELQDKIRWQWMCDECYAEAIRDV